MSESVETLSPFSEPRPAAAQVLVHITTREWIRHSVLLLLTIATTTFAGLFITGSEVGPAIPDPSSLADYIRYIPAAYVSTVWAYITYAFTTPHALVQGATFSVALLAILLAHEMGHYLACRRYGVNATLPFFIPAPPLFIAGTFGAFIKIRSPIPTRRALFDIGLAGPLAGFVMLLPVAVLGVLHLEPASRPISQGGLVYFHDPLLFRLIATLLRIPMSPDAKTNAYQMAAWIGLLVTSLNLMPVGQLDGGHGTFALFGLQAHKLIGRIAFVAVAILAALGWFIHHSPSGFVYTVLLGVMLFVRHPQPQIFEPLGTPRKIVAILTLLVFVLSFLPFPITLT